MKKQFLNLGKQPIANGFLNKNQIKDEFFYNLRVGFDEKTKLVTQMEYIDLPLMFNENYAYRGSMSKTMVNHFKVLSNYIKEILIKLAAPLSLTVLFLILGLAPLYLMMGILTRSFSTNSHQIEYRPGSSK